MSKRGGASELNGFISLRSDGKKTGTVSKKKDETTKKKVGDAERKKKDTDKELPRGTTEGRTRLGEEMRRIEVRETGRKETKTSSVRTKPETSSVKTSDSKRKETTTSSMKSKSSTSSQDKSKHSMQEVKKPKSDSLSKAKDVSSSPYVSGKVSKPKIVPSSQLKRQSSLQSNSSQDSPYRKSSLSQKPQAARTSLQERTRKPSQLHEMPSKMKVSSSSKTATSKSSKPAEPARTKKSSSSTKSKTKRDRSIPRISEEAEAVQKVRPFGEIPRSNTFTKEDGGFDSLTSDLSLSQAAEMQSLDNFGPQSAEAEGYNYEDDFEDYESDFEECTESEESSTKSEEETEDSSKTESLDEDELGDGLKAQPSTSVRSVLQEPPVKKSILKSNTDTTRLKPETNDVQSEKEKPTNVEEERKLDSGSYDLTSHADLRRKKQIQDIRAAMDKENATLSKQMGRQKRRSFAEDEGFVEVYGQESQATDADQPESSTKGFINFAAARKQQIKQKAKAKVRKRGAILMEMIRLDVMSFKLLDIPSVPYEVYMQCYGRSNTYQIHTQTNEDAISEEVQTEEVSSESKWTQHPVKYSSSKSPDELLFIFSQEKLGVGGEPTLSEKQDWLPKLHVNSLRLHNFINNAGEMILTFLEEIEQDRKHEVSRVSKQVDFGFSESFTSLSVAKVEFLKNRPVSIVQFSESNSSHIVTVHKPSNEERPVSVLVSLNTVSSLFQQPLTVMAESEGRCILCTWSVREPSSPLQTLVSSNDVSAVCLHSHLVFAGLVDGAVCLWDLREQSAIHCRCFLKEPDWLLRSPTYISAGLERERRHLSSVVSLKTLPESNPDDSAKTTANQTPTQVASLDGDGLLLVWTVVETRSAAVNIDSGLAPWGRVRLVQSSQLRVLKAFPRSVQHMLQCTCMQVDGLKPSNLYFGSNSGQVVHCMQSSTRAKPQFYAASSEGNNTITCMDFSKCGHSLLMVGDSGGRVQIYRTVTESPLLNIAASSTIPPPPVKSVQWSSSRPGLFFVLDTSSSIHVWDLCAGDMNSQMSVQFTPRVITSISLNPHIGSRMMAVASEAGTVEIYNLKSEFSDLPQKEFEELNSTFTRYIDLL